MPAEPTRSTTRLTAYNVCHMKWEECKSTTLSEFKGAATSFRNVSEEQFLKWFLVLQNVSMRSAQRASMLLTSEWK